MKLANRSAGRSNSHNVTTGKTTIKKASPSHNNFGPIHQVPFIGMISPRDYTKMVEDQNPIDDIETFRGENKDLQMEGKKIDIHN